MSGCVVVEVVSRWLLSGGILALRCQGGYLVLVFQHQVCLCWYHSLWASGGGIMAGVKCWCFGIWMSSGSVLVAKSGAMCLGVWLSRVFVSSGGDFVFGCLEVVSQYVTSVLISGLGV